MRRRDFVKVFGGAAATWPFAAHAQSQHVPVVGVLSPEGPATGNIDGLYKGLAELDYVEGQNIRFEYRWAEGNFARLPELASELVKLKVDLLVAFVTPSSLAAQRATSTIPIVMVGTADPVGLKIVASLARPGGNITGTSSIAVDTVGKQFELIKEIVGNPRRVSVIWNPSNPAFQAQQVRQAKAAGEALGMELQFHEASNPNDFGGAFEAVARDGNRAIVILIDPLYMVHHRKLAVLSMQSRLVHTMGFRPFAEAGGLMSFAPNYSDQYYRAAAYVDRILKGTKPADLPVEQASKIELVINQRTAKQLGIAIPAQLIVRADEVIE